MGEMDDSHSLAQSLSSWNLRPGDLKPSYRDRVLRCYGYVSDGGICVRANTMYNLVDLNMRMAERVVPLFVNEEYTNIHPSSKVDPKSNVRSQIFDVKTCDCHSQKFICFSLAPSVSWEKTR